MAGSSEVRAMKKYLFMTTLHVSFPALLYSLWVSTLTPTAPLQERYRTGHKVVAEPKVLGGSWGVPEVSQLPPRPGHLGSLRGAGTGRYGHLRGGLGSLQQLGLGWLWRDDF